MTKRIRKSPQATEDMLDLFTSIGERSLKSARRFLVEIQKTLNTLAIVPEIGPLWESDNPACAGIRYFPVRRFRRYLIFYRVSNEAIVVIRVLRGARDIHGLFE